MRQPTEIPIFINKMPKFVTIIICLFAVVSPLQGTIIEWSSGVGDEFFESDGVTLLDETFQFELGGFQSGFTPTLANLSLWESNWVSFDLANFANNSWNPTPGISSYTESGSLVAAGPGLVSSPETGGTFSIGQQAYLWTYNTKAISNTTEWALLVNPTWTYPAASDPSGPPAVQFWSLGDAGNTAVAGEVTPDLNNFSTLQTQAVPEPGSALMILIAGVVFRFRRKMGHR